MKKFFKYLSILVVVLILLGVAAYFLARKYEPQVRNVVVKELNSHLAVPVKVGDINLSLLQRFPYASLRFSDVVIPQVKNEKVSTDTLIYIEDLYLQIGLLDFLQKEYTVSEAEINTGYFQMEYYPKGGDNFHFWKSKNDSSSEASISITNVEIRNFDYKLATADRLEMAFHIAGSEASGDFGKSVYGLETFNDIRIESIINQGDTLYFEEKFEGDLDLRIDKEKEIYSFESSAVEVAQQNVKIRGKYKPGDAQDWTLSLKAEEANLEKLSHLLPLSIRKKASIYKAQGETDLNLDLSWGKDQTIDAGFSNLNGTFQHSEGLGIARIENAKGKLEIRNTIQSIFLDALDAQIGPGKISAWGKIIDLAAPSFDLNIAGTIDLHELKSLLNITLVDELSGEVELDGRLQGKLPRSSNQATVALLRGIDFNGKIKLSDGVFKMAGQHQKFDQIEGDIQLKNNAVLISAADARVNENPFQFSGKIKNALPYISRKGQKLSIFADFKAESLNFNHILTSEQSSRDTTYNFQLPDDISFDLGIDIGQLNFRKFEAKNIVGKAYYKSGLLTLNPLSFETANGGVNANFRVKEKSEKRFEVQSTAELNQLDLPLLFSEFENFGQSVVEAHHLEGRVDASIDFTTDFGKDLSIKMPTIQSEISLMVRNGKLKQLESLEAIGDYLRENALWNSLIRVEDFQKKLEVVSFDTLENRISISDELITIPAMRIGSSALTLNLTGTHSFSNEIDYSLNFKLSDLLRTGREKESDFGYIVDDNSGLRIFMKMEGTVDHPEFSMDGEAAQKKRKAQFESEKKEMKNILKEEFGLFKSDTTLTGVEAKKKQNAAKFSVDINDFKSKNDSSPKQKEKKKKNDNDDLFEDDDL